MNGITIFNSTDFGSVRTMEKYGEPYFCLSDICRILDIRNVSDCKTRLKPDGATVSDVQTNGGIQKATFINEGNLYRVIFQSKKPGGGEIHGLDHGRSDTIYPQKRRIFC